MQPAAPRNRLVFLCYRRADGQRIARELVKRLHGRTLPGVAPNPEFTNVIEVFLDVEQPANNDYLAFIEGRLAKAHALIYIATAGAAVRRAPVDHVRDELNSWLEARTDAPIVIDPYTSQGEYVPPELLKKFPRANRLEFRLDEWGDHAADHREQEIAKAVSRILTSIAIQVDEGAANVVREIEWQRAEAERAERRRRIGTWMAGLSAAVCLLALGFVLDGKQAADEARSAAERAQTDAVAARVAADAGKTALIYAEATQKRMVEALQAEVGERERCETKVVETESSLSDVLTTAADFDRRARGAEQRAKAAASEVARTRAEAGAAVGDLQTARAELRVREAELLESQEKARAKADEATALTLRLSSAEADLAATRALSEKWRAALDSAAVAQVDLKEQLAKAKVACTDSGLASGSSGSSAGPQDPVAVVEPPGQQ